MEKYRTCKKCNRILKLDSIHFHKDVENPEGFKLRCKECINGDKYKFVEDVDKILCRKCGKILPGTEEYFVINRNSGNLTSPCRVCRGLNYGKKRYDKKSLIPDNTKNKVCSKCFREIPKNTDYFYKNKYTKDKFSHRCRECHGSIFLQNTLQGYKFCKKCQQILPATHDFFYKDSNKLDNLATVCINCKKQYVTINKNNRAEQVRLRRKNDVEFKILNSLRNRIYHAIKGNTKSKPTVELLGCTINSFKEYLESRFSKDMCWDNYGKVWHIDHIKPCKLFNLQYKEDQLKCFNYENMQPMYKEENLKKQASNSNKVIYKTSKYFIENKEELLNNKNVIINEK